MQSVPLPDLDSNSSLHLRKAAMRDVEGMLQLIAHWARRGVMLPKSRDVLYQEIRDFYLLETQDGGLAGTVGLHVLWSDLAEIRSLAIHPNFHGKGLGKRLVLGVEDEARELGILRLFAWTLEPEFFTRCGYTEIDLERLPPKVYKEYHKNAMLKRI
jgi:amino-acid N-acetyltransferase